MDERWMPKDKPELMSTIEREWRLLTDVVEKLTDGQMTTPDSGGWSPKDNLAHITEWMNILIGYYIEGRPSDEVTGIPKDVTQDWDVDAVNKIFFERNKDKSLKDVRDGLRQMYDRARAKLESMTYEDLLKPRHADDPDKSPVLISVLENTTEHFVEHRETIAKFFNL